MRWIRKGFKVKQTVRMTMTVKLEIDASQQGLRMVLKDWEEQALKVFWDDPQKEYTSKHFVGSGQPAVKTWKHLKGFDNQLP
jgi:hypothetical protein